MARDCWQWETNGQCVKGDNCSFRHDVNKRAKITQPNPSPNSFMQQSERITSRTRSPRGRSPSGGMSRWPCKDYLKESCTNSFCEKWHPPECLLYKTKSGCRFGEKCSYAHRQVDEQPKKRSKKNDDKSAIAMLKRHELFVGTEKPVVCRDTRHERPERPDMKRDTCHELKQGHVGSRSSNARQLGCVFQEHGAAEVYLTKELRRAETNPTCEIHKAIARHTKIRDQKSFAWNDFAQVNLINVAPTLQNLRIGLRRRQSGKGKVPVEAAWKLTKNVLKLKDHERATFFSPS